MIAREIADLVGNTPLIEITHLELPTGTTLLAKAEFLNPTGSVKDRAASNMIERAIQRGEITAETTLIEPTSGNTGIGLAAVCAARGIRLLLTMPESMSPERRKLLTHLGARILLTPASEGMQGSIDAAQSLLARTPNAHILGQFSNPDNPAAHYHTTAEEILRQTQHAIDIFVAAVGTGGTLTGTARRLCEANPKTRIVAVEPITSAVLSGGSAGAHGIQGIGAGLVPSIMETDLIDEVLTVSDEEAITYARDAACHAGLLVGISAGANLAAAHRLALRSEQTTKTIVTILPDSAERYLSTNLFGDY
jgi:cysteine synthase A